MRNISVDGEAWEEFEMNDTSKLLSNVVIQGLQYKVAFVSKKTKEHALEGNVSGHFEIGP